MHPPTPLPSLPSPFQKAKVHQSFTTKISTCLPSWWKYIFCIAELTNESKQHYFSGLLNKTYQLTRHSLKETKWKVKGTNPPTVSESYTQNFLHGTPLFSHSANFCVQQGAFQTHCLHSLWLLQTDCSQDCSCVQHHNAMLLVTHKQTVDCFTMCYHNTPYHWQIVKQIVCTYYYDLEDKIWITRDNKSPYWKMIISYRS